MRLSGFIVAVVGGASGGWQWLHRREGGGLPASRCTGRLDQSEPLTVWMNMLKGFKWHEGHIAPNMYSARLVM